MAYAMALIIDGRELMIPVLPEKLKVKSSGKNEKSTILGIGEVLVLKKRGLREISWDSHFPAHSAPYVSGQITSPIDAIKALQTARDSLAPIRFLIVGTDLDINTTMGIDSIEYEEQYGAVGDIYYTLKLVEWRDYSPKRIVLPETTSKPARVQQSTRPGSPQGSGTANRSYTVVSGDCLWRIAKKYYGKGSEWRKIYDANKSVIGSNPNLIYPGQVLVIP